MSSMATNKKTAKKAVAKKAPANKKKAPATKKAAPKKTSPAKAQDSSAVGATSSPQEEPVKVVIYANDVKSKSLRKRILAWFRN